MPSSTVSLSGFGQTCVLPGPSGPSRIETWPRWTTGLSQGLTRWVYRTSDQRLVQWTLAFEQLPAATYADLVAFFEDAARGPERVWTYTHTDGRSYPARFLDLGLRFERSGPELWSTTIRLELEQPTFV
jgi:hypothetical protein